VSMEVTSIQQGSCGTANGPGANGVVKITPIDLPPPSPSPPRSSRQCADRICGATPDGAKTCVEASFCGEPA
jgi:hypothetical protein